MSSLSFSFKLRKSAATGGSYPTQHALYFERNLDAAVKNKEVIDKSKTFIIQ